VEEKIIKKIGNEKMEEECANLGNFDGIHGMAKMRRQMEWGYLESDDESEGKIMKKIEAMMA
jgi:hypothetical protein